MFILFFFNDTATTEIYTLSLHDALPICWLLLTRPLSLAFRWGALQHGLRNTAQDVDFLGGQLRAVEKLVERSEEHTSELQSPCNLVCRLLLEKQNNSSIWRVSPRQSQPC